LNKPTSRKRTHANERLHKGRRRINLLALTGLRNLGRPDFYEQRGLGRIHIKSGIKEGESGSK